MLIYNHFGIDGIFAALWQTTLTASLSVFISICFWFNSINSFVEPEAIHKNVASDSWT